MHKSRWMRLLSLILALFLCSCCLSVIRSQTVRAVSNAEGIVEIDGKGKYNQAKIRVVIQQYDESSIYRGRIYDQGAWSETPNLLFSTTLKNSTLTIIVQSADYSPIEVSRIHIWVSVETVAKLQLLSDVSYEKLSPPPGTTKAPTSTPMPTPSPTPSPDEATPTPLPTDTPTPTPLPTNTPTPLPTNTPTPTPTPTPSADAGLIVDESGDLPGDPSGDDPGGASEVLIPTQRPDSTSGKSTYKAESQTSFFVWFAIIFVLVIVILVRYSSLSKKDMGFVEICKNFIPLPGAAKRREAAEKERMTAPVISEPAHKTASVAQVYRPIKSTVRKTDTPKDPGTGSADPQ